MRCLDYGTYCPQGDETLEAFLNNERRIRRVPSNRVYVMNISDAEATFDYQRLARFLGRPIPASREIPRFKHNRCSVDGVLRGPWSSATDRAKIRVTEECDSLLRAHGMHHLLKPFTCSPDMKVSDAEMVLGSGLGATALETLKQPARMVESWSLRSNAGASLSSSREANAPLTDLRSTTTTLHSSETSNRREARLLLDVRSDSSSGASFTWD